MCFNASPSMLAGPQSLAPGLFKLGCDGIVVTDRITLSCSDLHALTDSTGYHQEERHYLGTDSAIGCGANSRYDAT
jgi:hypothetical protein